MTVPLVNGPVIGINLPEWLNVDEFGSQRDHGCSNGTCVAHPRKPLDDGKRMGSAAECSHGIGIDLRSIPYCVRLIHSKHLRARGGKYRCCGEGRPKHRSERELGGPIWNIKGPFSGLDGHLKKEREPIGGELNVYTGFRQER